MTCLFFSRSFESHNNVNVPISGSFSDRTNWPVLVHEKTSWLSERVNPEKARLVWVTSRLLWLFNGDSGLCISSISSWIVSGFTKISVECDYAKNLICLRLLTSSRRRCRTEMIQDLLV